MADDGEQLGLATAVTVAWLSNPHTRAGAGDVSMMLGSVRSALRGLDASSPEPDADGAGTTAAEHTPAVTKRKSLASPDYIVSMIDGTKHCSLKRHLRNHGLTPDEYRSRYGVKPDYPMVASGNSAARSATAKQHQFGRNTAAEAAPAACEDTSPEPVAEPAAESQSKVAPEPAAPAKRRQLGISGA